MPSSGQHPASRTLSTGFTGAETVRDLFAASLIAADPTAFTARAIRLRLPNGGSSAARQTWIISLGKAAAGMARAAVHELSVHHLPIAGGIIVAPSVSPPPHPSLVAVVGDHPLPGRNSAIAAAALGELCNQVRADDLVFVLISGGTSSLAAAPVDGVDQGDLVTLCNILFRSNLDIGRVNAIRKRFLRWGAGRLAMQLAPARVQQIVLSDVIGDDLAQIGSGPCTPDPSTAMDVVRLIDETSLAGRIPASLMRYLDRVVRGKRPETPKADAPAFLFPSVPAVQGNGGVLGSAALRARTLGFDPVIIVSEPLMGEAAAAGARVASATLGMPAGGAALWGGETTVTLGNSHGDGGRCQELALSAAIALHEAGAAAAGIFILAAGTDGRDGPTDAAGAIVDALTVERIIRAGVDPRTSLARHDSHEALHRGTALLKTGLTGTNVGDVVIAVRQ